MGAPIVGVVGLVLAANRWRGRRIVVLEGSEPPGVPLRFSIRLICLLTALSAVLVRAGMMHRESLTVAEVNDVFVNEHLVSIWFAVGVNGLGLAVIGLLSYWAVLSPGRIWWRLLLLAAAVGLLGVAVPWGGAKEDDILLMVGWYSATALFVAATLFVMRAAGFRWMKTHTAVTPNAARSATHSSPLRVVSQLARSLMAITVFSILTLGAIHAKGHSIWPDSTGPSARLAAWIEGNGAAAYRQYYGSANRLWQ